MMQFDPKTLSAILSQDNDTLWQTIRRVAAEGGIALPPGKPSDADLDRLRQVLAGKGASDVGEAMRIFKQARGRG